MLPIPLYTIGAAVPAAPGDYLETLGGDTITTLAGDPLEAQ